MAFQSVVNIEPAVAVAGDRVNNDLRLYTAHNYVNTAEVTCGGFVWPDATAPETAVKATAESGAPLGVVERTHENVADTVFDVDSLTIPAGGVVSIIRKGDVYLTADTTVTIGMKAFAVLADGSVKFAAASSTVTGAVETDFVALTAGAAGDLIICSNWSK